MLRSGRILPFGAQVTVKDGIRGTLFRAAAPGKSSLELALARSNGYEFIPLENDGDGVFSTFLPGIDQGDRYKFRIDGSKTSPDPYTRSQPDDVHGDSEIIDPLAYEWNDDEWNGLRLDEMIIYELHVGAFTEKGTFDAVIDRLHYLKELGINAIELLPICEFPGKRNWGYDGVQFFAPDAQYGGPYGLKRLIDKAHQSGIAVIIDVVYNHFGPDGNYLRRYSRDYFNTVEKTPWGDALNYDGANCRLMRTYAIENALFWMQEYHGDGLRIDASFSMADKSEIHILREIARRKNSEIADSAPRTIILEDHRNLASFHWPEPKGFGIEGQWVDDFHDSLHAHFTKESDGYYENYCGDINEIVKIFNEGFLYQGQFYKTKNSNRGTPPERLRGCEMIIFIQNHDQVGNRAFGERLNRLIGRDAYHLSAALMFIAPFTPLLFMGQEYAADQPFLFFTDHKEGLGRAVTEGRRNEFKRFNSFSDPDKRRLIPDPQDEETFLRSKLNPSDYLKEPYSYSFKLHKILIDLIKSKPALSLRDRRFSSAFCPGGNILAVVRRSNSEADEYFLALANLDSNEAALNIEAIRSRIAERRETVWDKPQFSTLSEEFGSSGKLPKIIDDKADIIMLPAWGFFLYSI